MFRVLHRWAFNDYLIQWLWAVLQTVDSKSVPSFLLTNREKFIWAVNLSTKKKPQKSLTWGHVYISGQWAVSRNLFHIIFRKHVLCQIKRCSFRGHVCLLSSSFLVPTWNTDVMQEAQLPSCDSEAAQQKDRRLRPQGIIQLWYQPRSSYFHLLVWDTQIPVFKGYSTWTFALCSWLTSKQHRGHMPLSVSVPICGVCVQTCQNTGNKAGKIGRVFQDSKRQRAHCPPP